MLPNALLWPFLVGLSCSAALYDAYTHAYLLTVLTSRPDFPFSREQIALPAYSLYLTRERHSVG